MARGHETRPKGKADLSDVKDKDNRSSECVRIKKIRILSVEHPLYFFPIDDVVETLNILAHR